MELPEVEIVCRQMRPALKGKTICRVWTHPSKKFTPALKSKASTIANVGRHGKYILIQMQNSDFELICHLGMSGSLSLEPQPTADPYIRARWNLQDNTCLELRDVRRFGYVFFVPKGDYQLIPTLQKAGFDALSSDFTPESLRAAIAKSKRCIKTQLLSQIPVAGLGNIYIDEALWRSGISPKRKSLGPEKAKLLHSAIKECLDEGIANGGTTLRDYRTFDGEKGSHQNALLCYGRAGQPCYNCGKDLIFTKLDGRGTTYCSSCQS